MKQLLSQNPTMLISSRLPLLVALAAGTTPLTAQKTEQVHAVTVAGRGPETYVLLSGMVGGVAGFRRLEARLVLQGYRVTVADIVARIHVPVTVLLGDAPHDSGPGLAELEALTPLGALVRIEHMAGVGHFPHEEAPDEVARLILAPRTVAVGCAAGAGR